MKYTMQNVTENDYKNNLITKDLEKMLRRIDKRVSWVEYVPSKMIPNPYSLIIIGFDNGKTKYVEVTQKEPFAIARTVFNALDDYCVEVQFLTEKKLRPIENNINELAKSRMEITEHILSAVDNELSDKECLELYDSAQLFSIVPECFPFDAVKEEDTRNVLSDFLRSYSATFVDILWFQNKIEAILEKENEVEEER